MKPLTPTAIKAATRCPLSYHLAYTERVAKARPSANQWRGIAVHRALRALAGQRMAGATLDVGAAVGPDRFRVAGLLAAAINRGLFASKPIASEHAMAGIIAGAVVEARADRVDADMVVEYKTGGVIDDHDRVQAGILARLAGKPCRIVVLDPWTVEDVDGSAPLVEAAVALADRVRRSGDRTPHVGTHCAKCPVRGSCPHA